MNDDSTTRRVRRGYLLVAGLVLTALLVFNIDVIADQFRDHVDVVALVRETSGVRIGSPVSVAGVEVGRVTAIDFVGDPAAPVAVSVRLQERARTAVRRTSRARTARRRFIGEPVVRIEAGPDASPPVEDGDTLRPRDEPSIEELLERGLAFPSSLDSLQEGVGRLHLLIDRRRPALDSLVDRLALATAEAEDLRQQVRNGPGRWLGDAALPRRIERLRQHVEALSAAMGRLGREAEGGEIGPQLRSFAARAERLEDRLDALGRTLTEGSGTLGRLQRDSALAVAVREVAAQVDSLRAEGLDFALRMFLP